MACISVSRSYLDVYPGPDVTPGNAFKAAAAPADPPAPLPTFEGSRHLLPQPFWQGHEELEIAAYWKAWQLAFNNLANPKPESGFISPFIRTAFNGG